MAAAVQSGFTARFLPVALLLVLGWCGLWGSVWAEEGSGLRAATFDMDATPPIGAPMAYDAVRNTWDLSLRARGLVLLGAGEPIVLCAVDWVGIGNAGNDAFRAVLAEAAGTTAERVAVHTLHQHDAPDCDFSVEKILEANGIALQRHDGSFARSVLARLGKKVRAALDTSQPITHVGLGSAEVEKVASNRRIPGADGKVRAVRYTACRDAALRAEPEGTIDPVVSLVSLWNGERPVAVLSYYACHPQSYYHTGLPNPDFPGVARFLRQMAVPEALHIHFDGAGGNIGAGKYNDGSKENRLILAERLADGMRRAWESTQREPLSADAAGWAVCPVAVPPAPHLNVEELEAQVRQTEDEKARRWAARHLAWLRRCEAGHRIDVACLRLGRARILHLPGELFVEYQLAAKAAAPDCFVAMAAYGDYATGYIGTAVAYEEGGYETNKKVSRVAPETEAVLMGAVRNLLALAQ